MGFLKLSKIKYLDDTLYELEKSLKKHDDLIGIEYLVLIGDAVKNYDDSVFTCILCSNDINSKDTIKNVIKHMRSRDHQLKFIEENFPTVYKQLMKIKILSSSYLDKLCEKIMRKHREYPSMILSTQLKNRIKIVKEIKESSKCKEEETDKEILTELSKMINDHVKTLTFDDWSKNSVEKYQNVIKCNSNNASTYENDYKRLKDKIETKYDLYNSTPNQHPQYHVEFKYFYSLKFRFEHQKNPKVINIEEIRNKYENEWTLHFKELLKELQKGELVEERYNLRRRNNIPTTSIDQDDLETIVKFHKDTKAKICFNEEVQNEIQQLQSRVILKRQNCVSVATDCKSAKKIAKIKEVLRNDEHPATDVGSEYSSSLQKHEIKNVFNITLNQHPIECSQNRPNLVITNIIEPKQDDETQRIIGLFNNYSQLDEDVQIKLRNEYRELYIDYLNMRDLDSNSDDSSKEENIANFPDHISIDSTSPNDRQISDSEY